MKFIKRLMIILLSIIAILVLVTYVYTNLPQFGALPKGTRIERIKKSPQYRDGKFRNKIEKPIMTEGHNTLGELYKLLFKKYPNKGPLENLPSIKTDLKSLPIDSNQLVWFGHSSYFLQLDSVKILVDPVFSGQASPLPSGVKAYNGSDIYTVDDMPELDYLLISHDHYDHLDYKTVKALQPKVKQVICGLGVGAHLERWGYHPQQIIEKDWGEKTEIRPGYNIYAEESHHGSGRGFKMAQSLWLSFVIQSPTLTIYYSGDGGYTDRYKQIPKKYGAIDWAIMDCGQYNKSWHAIHALPEEVAVAAMDLNALNLLPVHHSKFTLSRHPWNEPLNKISELSQSKPYKLATPMIGEAVKLDDSTQMFQQWWK